MMFNEPRVGSARNIVNPAGGLAVGDPFTIPPFAFAQQLGPQIGQVLKNVSRQLDMRPSPRCRAPTGTVRTRVRSRPPWVR